MTYCPELLLQSTSIIMLSACLHIMYATVTSFFTSLSAVPSRVPQNAMVPIAIYLPDINCCQRTFIKRSFLKQYGLCISEENSLVAVANVNHISGFFYLAYVSAEKNVDQNFSVKVYRV